jgi:hypothetical protein
MGSFSLTTGILYGGISAIHLHSIVMLKTFITHTTIATMSSFLMAMVTFGIAWHFRVPHHKRIRINNDLQLSNEK